MSRVLLFDLDETLVAEAAADLRAAETAAATAAGRCGVDATTLAEATLSRARGLWARGPMQSYCMRIGIAGNDGLWCRFEGKQPETVALRRWADTFRQAVWTQALAEQGIEDPALAKELSERFGEERHALHEPFDDVLPALEAVRDRYALGLVTNGASCLQREKLVASGLAEYFEAIVISAEVGIGKPHASVFHEALARLGETGEHAVMFGDTLSADVDGARGAGLKAVWLNRFRQERPPDRADLVEAETLSDLAGILEDLA